MKANLAFEKNHACEHAIGEFISEVVKNIQLGKIFLDLSKAFDMLEHSVVYQKLERYGIRLKPLIGSKLT